MRMPILVVHKPAILATYVEYKTQPQIAKLQGKIDALCSVWLLTRYGYRHKKDLTTFRELQMTIDCSQSQCTLGIHLFVGQ